MRRARNDPAPRARIDRSILEPRPPAADGLSAPLWVIPALPRFARPLARRASFDISRRHHL